MTINLKSNLPSSLHRLYWLVLKLFRSEAGNPGLTGELLESPGNPQASEGGLWSRLVPLLLTKQWEATCALGMAAVLPGGGQVWTWLAFPPQEGFQC